MEVARLVVREHRPVHLRLERVDVVGIFASPAGSEARANEADAREELREREGFHAGF
jgi:hypothetical protein